MWRSTGRPVFSSRGVADVGAVAPVLLWAVVLLRWRSVTGTRYQRSLWLTLLASAIAATVANAAVADAMSRHAGANGSLAVPVTKHVLVLVAAAMAIELVRDVALPEAEARVGQGGRLVVLAAAAVSLAAAGVAVAVGPDRRLALPGAAFSVPLLIYWLVLMSYLGFSLGLVTRWAAWFRFRTPAAPVRTSLSLIGTGSAVGLVYVAHKVALLAVLPSRPDSGFVRSASLVETLLIAIAFLFIAIGCATPAISRSRSRLVASVWAYAELGRLWRQLCAVTPSIALVEPDASRSRRAVRLLRDLRLGIYRRVIEIRDGELAVRAYAPPVERERIAEQARRCGLDPTAPGLVEATELELARRSKSRGGRPVPVPPVRVIGGTDLESEITYLRLVSRAGRAATKVADRIEQEVGL